MLRGGVQSQPKPMLAGPKAYGRSREARVLRRRSGRSRGAVCALHRADARGGRCFRVVWRTGLTVGRTSRLKASPWRSAQPVPWSCGGTSVARSALSCSTSRVSRFCVPGIKPLHRLALDPSHAVCSVSQTTKSISLGSVEWRARCMLARANSASAPRSDVTLTRVRIEEQCHCAQELSAPKLSASARGR